MRWQLGVLELHSEPSSLDWFEVLYDYRSSPHLITTSGRHSHSLGMFKEYLSN